MKKQKIVKTKSGQMLVIGRTRSGMSDYLVRQAKEMLAHRGEDSSGGVVVTQNTDDVSQIDHAPTLRTKEGEW